MTGISYKETVDDAGCGPGWRADGSHEQPRRVLKNVGERLLNSVGDNFDKERGPAARPGSPWRRPPSRRGKQTRHAPLAILRPDSGISRLDNAAHAGNRRQKDRIELRQGRRGHPPLRRTSRTRQATTVPARPYLGSRPRTRRSSPGSTRTRWNGRMSRPEKDGVDAPANLHRPADRRAGSRPR